MAVGHDGIAYNAKLTKPITSVDQLLEDRSLKGKVTMLDDFSRHARHRDARQRRRPEQGHRRRLQERASTASKAASDSGQIRQFTGNDYTGPLSKGDLKACLAWSGDIVQLQADNPNLKWGIPDEGGMIWTDNMLIPKGGDAYTASVYMNFVYDPEVAAQDRRATSTT